MPPSTSVIRPKPEASRNPSAKGSRTPFKRQSEGSLSLRVASSSLPIASTSLKSTERRVSFEDPDGASLTEPAPHTPTPVRRRATTTNLRNRSGETLVHLQGSAEALPPMGAATRVRIVPYLVLSVRASVGATSQVSQHRLPSGWLQQYLNTNPDDLEAAGVSVQAAHVPDSHGKWLDTPFEPASVEPRFPPSSPLRPPPGLATQDSPGTGGCRLSTGSP